MSIFNTFLNILLQKIADKNIVCHIRGGIKFKSLLFSFQDKTSQTIFSGRVHILFYAGS